MSVEINRGPEQINKVNASFLVVGGGMSTEEGLIGLQKAFKNIFSGNVLVMTSLLSPQQRDTSQLQQEANFVKANISVGENVVVVTHSIGLQEFGRAKDILADVNFFDNPENAKRLKLIVNAPSGLFNGKREIIPFLYQYARLLGPTNLGINAINAFPPQNMTDEELINSMNLHMGRWVQSDPSTNRIDFIRHAVHSDRLSQEKKKKELLAQNDSALKEASQHGKARKFRRLVRKRGSIIKDEVQEVFDGKDQVSSDYVFPSNISRLKMLSQSKVLLRDMFGQKSFDDLVYLLEKGVDVTLVNSALDRAVPLRRSIRFRAETQKLGKAADVVVFERLGHSGMTLDPQAFANGVKELVHV